MFCEDIMVDINDPDSDNSVIYPRRMIEFIVKEPALSWYKDNFYADFNEEYVSREEAEAAYKEFKKHKKLEAEMLPQLDKEYLQAVIKELDNEYETYVIVDEGDCTSPRYSMWTYDKKYKPGHYEMFSQDSLSNEKLAKLKQKLNEKARANDLYWFVPIDSLVAITTQKKYEKLLQNDEVTKYKVKEFKPAKK
jgi:hypothetical protein